MSRDAERYAPVGSIVRSGYWQHWSVVLAHPTSRSGQDQTAAFDGTWCREVTIADPQRETNIATERVRTHLTSFFQRGDAIVGRVLGEPQYTHDCDAEHGCTWVGTFTVPNGRTIDGWFHESQWCLIARQSDEPSDYLSLTPRDLDRSMPRVDMRRTDPLQVKFDTIGMVQRLVLLRRRFPTIPTI